MTSNILVIGGTGKTGRKVVERLTARNHQVRIGSRRATPAFDWQDPATWPDALHGMDKVYITYQPDLAVPGAADAIRGLTALAQQHNIKKVVLLSGKGEIEAEKCEQIVMESGINFTIVRASWFNQNFSESFFLDPILSGHVALPKADVKIPFIDTDDIAEVVVEALLSDEHNGHIYNLTGPGVRTFREVIQEISGATGRNIQFTEITMDQYINALEEAGVPSNYIWLINYLFTNVIGNPKNSVISHDIEKVLGRKAKDFSAYVKEVASTGVWSPELVNHS